MSLIQLVKNKYRKSRQANWNRLYDLNHFRKVEIGLRNLALQGKVLRSSDSKLAEDYARTVLGSLDFAPWLKLYTTYRGQFVEGWIPDNYLGRVVCPAINKEYRSLGKFKTLTKRIVNTESIPDLAYFIKGNWITLEGETLSFSEMKTYLFDRQKEFFLKTDSSFQGKGVFKLDRKKFSELDYTKLGDFVIQEPIQQHPFFEEISPGVVATLRITTVKPYGKPAKNHLSALRIGVRGMDFIGPDHALRIPIWPNDGKFFDEVTNINWVPYERHPDTGVLFENQIIPHYDKVIQLCEQLHDQFAHFQLIGWDTTIDLNGNVKIMEWNTDEPGIVFSEVSTGPSFLGLGWEDLWKEKK
jgi:hypothetical protein